MGNPNTNIREEAPCIAACAINQDARDYVQLIARGMFKEAFQLVRSKNPFPASCGRICTRRCEEACRRSAVDEPIAIAWLKRFLADKDLDAHLEIPPQKYPEKIAIIAPSQAKARIIIGKIIKHAFENEYTMNSLTINEMSLRVKKKY